MLKLRAVFDNPEGILFPNQFVNIKLKIDTLENIPLVRDIAIRRGTSGEFVYIITDENKVKMRPVTTGPAKNNMIAIINGIKAGERVAIDGLDRLRDGTDIIPIDREAQAREETPRTDSVQ
jgi:multidrug efflux system membrane fusion protein